jgi:hypothetical protein
MDWKIEGFEVAFFTRFPSLLVNAIFMQPEKQNGKTSI